MKTFREEIFRQYASDALQQLNNELREKYEPKKEGRFSFNKITYEIGPVMMIENGLEFEMSSKIPQEEFPEGALLTDYFNTVRDLLSSIGKELISIDRENIVREINVDEIKERDYVKLKFQYSYRDLYRDEEIMKEAEEIRKTPSKRELPVIPNVHTIAGRLVLLSIRERTYELAHRNIQALIDANEQVRAEFRNLQQVT
ncbi:MAG: hypothetical protein HY731_08900 [Candidatus Tectomicrobia bacterium]|nr:hypothetical protein [Candidatus Tectomicrobia bacterium]